MIESISAITLAITGSILIKLFDTRYLVTAGLVMKSESRPAPGAGRGRSDAAAASCDTHACAP